MIAPFSIWLRALALVSLRRRRRPQGYTVIIWQERASGRRVVTYCAGTSEGMIGHKQILAFSPAASGVGDPDAWQPTQRWDQHSRLFIDIISKGPVRSSK